MTTLAEDNQIIYYQCKSCLSFVTSTKKWDRHLPKCLLKQRTSTGICIPVQQRPVGFRLVPFTELSIMLDRVKLSVIKTSSVADASSHSHKKKNKCLENKIGYTDNSKNIVVIRQPRKSFLKAKAGLQEVFTKIQGNENEESDDGRKCVSEKQTLGKIGTNFKKPKKNQRPNKEAVSRYRTFCHLCPAKFMKQKELDVHINSVHHGDRRLMSCLVCERIFNKRDSLNSHLLAHEAAEAKEEKYNLFKPWTNEILKMIRANKAKAVNEKCIATTSNCPLYCKVCLLRHYRHHSYLQHFLTEHANPPESFRIKCKLNKCSVEFPSIRTLIAHAKLLHPREFYGKLTWLRMTNGIYTGKQVRSRDEHGKDIPLNKRAMPTTNKRAQQRERKKNPPNGKKRICSFTPKGIRLELESESIAEQSPDDGKIYENFAKSNESSHWTEIKLEDEGVIKNEGVKLEKTSVLNDLDLKQENYI